MKIELIQQNRFPLLTQTAPPPPHPSPPQAKPVKAPCPHLEEACKVFFFFFLFPRGVHTFLLMIYCPRVRNFIYRRCPLLNLLLVSEHDKRISSVPLHLSYIVLAAKISRMRFSEGESGGG